MNLLAGLEKFGLKADETTNIYEDDKKSVQAKQAAGGAAAKQESPMTEADYLISKEIRCVVCDQKFKTKMVKNGRVKRLEPDMDLRPRFAGIDTNKYKVTSCPFCGYTAMNQFFEHLSTAQIKLIKEQVCANFKASGAEEPQTFTYDETIDRYKLALFNTIVKKGKTSEKAYVCLNLAWVYRGKAESLDASDPKQAAEIKECKEQEEVFYQQAYEGFTKSISTENFPICGMDSSTMDYLLATMSYHYKKYDMASRCIANILSSATSSAKMKDNMRDLKDRIVADIKNAK
jgi:hypothetical protein